MLNQNTELKSRGVGFSRFVRAVLKPLLCNSMATTLKMVIMAIIP